MKPDNYTKSVLTIIALCLVVIAAKDIALVPNAQAADFSSPCYGMAPLNEDGSMNVRVVDPEYVEVKLIGSSGGSLNGAGLMEVEVSN